jgi:mRNA interferase MazF
MDANQKHFKEWAEYQEKLDSSDHKPPLFNEGEIWWCHIGDNIGTELCGKGSKFNRPVVVLRKIDRGSFIGLCLIGKSKKGDWYYQLNINDDLSSVVLIQVNYFDYRRLNGKIGAVLDNQLRSIRERFIERIS